MTPELDGVDRGVLYLLQRDARNTTAREIAEQGESRPARSGIGSPTWKRAA